MNTTYLIGMFIPKGIKRGDRYNPEPKIPIRVTELQKQMLVDTPSKRRDFVDQALEGLRDIDPALVKEYEKGHDFNIVDPQTTLGKNLQPYILLLQQQPKQELEVDLTEVEVLKRH